MNKKKMFVLALAMGIISAPAAFADTHVNTPKEKKSDRLSKYSEKAPRENQGQHTGQIADQYLQSILGMTADQLKAELQSGKTIKDIITAKGLSFETVMKQVREKHEADMKSKLDADVKSGKITQAQADAMLQKMNDNEIKRDEAMSKALGISVADLTTLTAGGKTIEEIATEKGLTKESIKKALETANKPVSKGQKKGIIKKIKQFLTPTTPVTSTPKT